MEKLLKEENIKDPRNILYVILALKNYPGKFLLSYLLKTKCRRRYRMVIAEEYGFGGQLFDSLNGFLKRFKDHYSDPIAYNTSFSTPLTTPSVRIYSEYDTSRNIDSNMISQQISTETIINYAITCFLQQGTSYDLPATEKGSH